jgi:hypothetical protein
MRWAEHVARKEEARNVYILVGNSGCRSCHGRPRRGYKDNIKMDLREIVWEGVDWILLTPGRDKWRALVDVVMCLRIP